MTLQAIFFDMDGTLTVPWIDWTKLRTAIGATDGLGIIDYVETLPPPQQEQAEAVVREFEMDAAHLAPANLGLAEVFTRLDELPLRRALITNNHRAAMNLVVERYELSFDLCLSREDGVLKPAPDLLLIALRHSTSIRRPPCLWGMVVTIASPVLLRVCVMCTCPTTEINQSRKRPSIT